MKQIKTFVVATLAVLTLAACGSSGGGGGSNNTPDPTGAVAGTHEGRVQQFEALESEAEQLARELLDYDLYVTAEFRPEYLERDYSADEKTYLQGKLDRFILVAQRAKAIGESDPEITVYSAQIDHFIANAQAYKRLLK